MVSGWAGYTPEQKLEYNKRRRDRYAKKKASGKLRTAKKPGKVEANLYDIFHNRRT